jgi:hypothetical protein
MHRSLGRLGTVFAPHRSSTRDHQPALTKFLKNFCRISPFIVAFVQGGLGTSVAFAADAAINSSTFQLLPYTATGYHFKAITSGAAVPVGFEQPNFDDSEFDAGDGAFGSSGTLCALQPRVNTAWPVQSDLLVRHIISVPTGAEAVRLMVSVDNDIICSLF